MFVASLEGFFFGPRDQIIADNGEIGPFYPRRASLKQKEYLNLLRDFEKGKIWAFSRHKAFNH